MWSEIDNREKTTSIVIHTEHQHNQIKKLSSGEKRMEL